MSDNLKKTPLYDACLKAGGRMVDFHGWLLPVQYESIIAEHKAVRNAAGLFDVSHMGQIIFKGEDAYKFLQNIATNNFKQEPGAGAYAHILNDDGGIIDDIIAFCINPNEFFLVVNSATRYKDYNWFVKKSAGYKVEVSDVSDDYAMLALQGPKALDILEKLVPQIKEIARFHIKQDKIFDASVYITRTGYTGEDGVEIMGDAQTINKLFDWCLANGFTPCGLGARDVLRLEAGYLLSGSDMDETRNPYEASCGWVVKLKKEEDFTAKAKMAAVKEAGVKEKWTGFILQTAGVAREGCLVFKDGKQIGKLTSATYSPLFKGICAGYAPADLEEGATVEIEVRGRKLPAKKIKMPFYKNRV